MIIKLASIAQYERSFELSLMIGIPVVPSQERSGIFFAVTPLLGIKRSLTSTCKRDVHLNSACVRLVDAIILQMDAELELQAYYTSMAARLRHSLQRALSHG